MHRGGPPVKRPSRETYTDTIMSQITTKTVALVGHCGPDSSFLRMAVSGAAPGAKIVMADSEKELDDALENGADLLMFNRVMEIGFDERDGVTLMRGVKEKHPDQAVLMVSNYPETQQQAEAAGASPGFGKRDIGSEKAKTRLREALGL